MTTPAHTPRREARCAHCAQPRPVFPPKPEWGRVPDPMCSPCWSKFADARAAGTYVDWSDAFDNATDDELLAAIDAQPTPAVASSGSGAGAREDGAR